MAALLDQKPFDPNEILVAELNIQLKLCFDWVAG
jgi:hypothetical protein